MTSQPYYYKCCRTAAPSVDAELIGCLSEVAVALDVETAGLGHCHAAEAFGLLGVAPAGRVPVPVAHARADAERCVHLVGREGFGLESVAACRLDDGSVNVCAQPMRIGGTQFGIGHPGDVAAD